MNETFDQILSRVKRPSRYLGTEINATKKDPTSVISHAVFAFPDMYELGMSYLGLQVLYRAVNDEPDLWMERVFTPDFDMERQLHQQGLDLSSLESQTPLKYFDVVAFSLQHELTYLDVISILKLGGVPVRTSKRTEAHPFVIAGGPCATNPEPLAEALDIVVLGDGEIILPAIVRTVGTMRKQGKSRQAIYDRLQAMDGIYLPSRYQVSYFDNGGIESMITTGSAPGTIARTVINDLDSLAPPSSPVIPFAQAVHDRIAVEIQRGCTRGCRFCHAGMINRPVRQRTKETILAAVDSGLKTTGYDQVSFLSLSAGDHPQILTLLEGFFNAHGNQRISASLPSLRAETLTTELAELVRTVRKSGFTIAPEAGTERLRKVINKDLSERDIVAAAVGAYDAGWRLIKLYFMLGLPTETDEDLEGISQLVLKVRSELRAKGHKPRINVGLSTFIPKPHTPFQWEPLASIEEMTARLNGVRKRLQKIGGVKVTWSRPELSWAEGILSRGDRRQFEALVQLVESGNRLAGWSEHFRLDEFRKAFSSRDLLPHPEFWLRERANDEVLPWDHLDMGPTKDFLLQERHKAYQNETTPDCSVDICTNCGACENDLAPMVQPTPKKAISPHSSSTWDEKSQVKIRLCMAKRNSARLLGHREFMVALFRAFRRAKWPLKHTEGFHPKPKVSFGPACQTGVASEAEWLDVTLQQLEPIQWLTEKLEAELPEGIVLLSFQVLEQNAPGIMKDLSMVRYIITIPNTMDMNEAILSCERMMKRKTWVIRRPGKNGTKSSDVRSSIRRLELADDGSVRTFVLDISTGPGVTARPGEVAKEVFGLGPRSVLRQKLIWKTDGQKNSHKSVEQERGAKP